MCQRYADVAVLIEFIMYLYSVFYTVCLYVYIHLKNTFLNPDFTLLSLVISCVVLQHIYLLLFLHF